MKQNAINSVAKPTVNLTINKSRLKIYNSEKEPTYYLKDGQEFQLELFNPTQKRVLAKIELNGNLISQGGIVLRPAERVFLERYIDVAKKFLFETYEVSGNEVEVKAAIQNNGSIRVIFYEEDTTPKNQNILTTPHPFYRDYYYYDVNPFNRNNTGSPYNGDLTFTSISTNTTFFDNSAVLGSASLGENDTLSVPESLSKSLTRQIKAKKKTETGRIEVGSDSSQNFKTVNYKFYSYPSHTVEYKLLPISQKVNTTKDIKVKMYCHECGTKIGKGHKFCNQCGTKQ